ncbi:hypothetical protein SAMN04488523_101482 [Sulfitobacter brevis]|uniref:Uncharacterized protein n=1 Tax=Sulfitobacter brevis TaxID=74348 RepID=A0A1I1TZB2_9RHOB|nr:hypothetical protein [Sulfitobacter brevis]SFD60960.1 hypothetical protein SAMN04488523_101482 [Sulfitobacter brevis]
MSLLKIYHWLRANQGTIGTDWFVLTAVILGTAIVVLASIQAGPNGLAYNVATYFTG